MLNPKPATTDVCTGTLCVVTLRAAEGVGQVQGGHTAHREKPGRVWSIVPFPPQLQHLRGIRTVESGTNRLKLS